MGPKLPIALAFLLIFLAPVPSFAEDVLLGEQNPLGETELEAQPTQVFSMGPGLAWSPGSLMLAPEYHILWSSRLRVGARVQLGLGNAKWFTVSGTARLGFSSPDPKWQPFAVAGAGFAFASSSGFNNSLGVHVLMGGGLDYELRRDIHLGASMEFNFLPPIDNLILTFPLMSVKMFF